jgi:ubiquinone/menaquinone biosynthesis C-methylase UbiE
MFQKIYVIEDWLQKILVNPITKKKENRQLDKSQIFNASIYLKNTYGWSEWEKGQNKFETWLSKGEYKSESKTNFIKEKKEISKLYKNFDLSGIIVDLGGSVGTLREFISSNSKFVSIDPHQDPLSTLTAEKIATYKCLKEPLNYIQACAEFLPLDSNSVDLVHMRSMLDHVQVPDLVLIEARRVLKKNGKIIIGIYLPRGKNNNFSFKHFIKEGIRKCFDLIGFAKFTDYHTWHPSYDTLKKLILENGFEITKEIWQSGWDNKVVYIEAKK